MNREIDTTVGKKRDIDWEIKKYAESVVEEVKRLPGMHELFKKKVICYKRFGEMIEQNEHSEMLLRVLQFLDEILIRTSEGLKDKNTSFKIETPKNAQKIVSFNPNYSHESLSRCQYAQTQDENQQKFVRKREDEYSSSTGDELIYNLDRQNMRLAKLNRDISYVISPRGEVRTPMSATTMTSSAEKRKSPMPDLRVPRARSPSNE